MVTSIELGEVGVVGKLSDENYEQLLNSLTQEELAEAAAKIKAEL